jgi:hypothetical protein
MIASGVLRFRARAVEVVVMFSSMKFLLWTQ